MNELLGRITSSYVTTITISDRSATGSYVWDGKTIANHYHDSRQTKVLFDLNFLAHEVAHWIVATSKQREVPEYGMTSFTDLGCLQINRSIPIEEWLALEKRATRKGYIIYEKCIGQV